MKKTIARVLGFYLNTLSLLAPKMAARKGFYLFCTPLPAPVRDYHLKFFESAEKSTFEHEGIQIQTYRWGHGPKKVLFVHGWQSHSFRWKNYIESFSKEDFTLYALDAPAHGLSGGKYINLPLYSRVIEHFIAQIQPVDAVISHSFGSFAMLHALYHSSALPVGRLVIMGSPGEAEDFIRYYQKVLGLSPRAMKLVLDHFEKDIHHPPSYYSAARFAQSITVPGLIIHDEQDKDTSYRYAVDIHAAWKNSRLITTSGLGHNLKSKDVVRWVMEFVSESERVSDYR
jgi:pimeloyl-ACP methyl ester carboxylesterase